MSTKQSLIREIESLPPNVIDEVYQYVSFLKFKTNIPDSVTMAGVKQPSKSIESFFGCMKGKISEAEDHDWFEPLEDFEEYM